MYSLSIHFPYNFNRLVSKGSALHVRLLAFDDLHLLELLREMRRHCKQINLVSWRL